MTNQVGFSYKRKHHSFEGSGVFWPTYRGQEPKSAMRACQNDQPKRKVVGMAHISCTLRLFTAASACSAFLVPMSAATPPTQRPETESMATGMRTISGERVWRLSIPITPMVTMPSRKTRKTRSSDLDMRVLQMLKRAVPNYIIAQITLKVNKDLKIGLSTQFDFCFGCFCDSIRAQKQLRCFWVHTHVFTHSNSSRG